MILGALFLALSGAIAITGLQLMNFYVALLLLGVGWNFGFVGATSLLNSELHDDEKALYQGINDTIIALGGTLASFASGLLVASFGWIWVAVTLMVLAGSVGLSSLLQARYATCADDTSCLLYTSPSPRDATLSRMPSSA